MNATQSVDSNGNIKELISPGDCTDLCSTIDQEIGSFVKAHFTKPFMKHFQANPDRWQMGRVSARTRRRLFTVWVGDAVDALMLRRDIISFICDNLQRSKSNDHIPCFSWNGCGDRH